jgi:hypothetical protein
MRADINSFRILAMRQETVSVESVSDRIRPRRRIEGISAVFLPFDGTGQPDYDTLAAHLARRADAGFPGLLIAGSAYTYLQEWLSHVAAPGPQRRGGFRRPGADAAGLPRIPG